MDGDNIISWNVENWITIFLMAFLGFAVIGLLAQVLRKATSPKMQTSGNVIYGNFGG